MNNSVLNIVRIAKKYGYKTSIIHSPGLDYTMCRVEAYAPFLKSPYPNRLWSKRCTKKYAAKVLDQNFEDYPFKGGY